MNYLLCIVFSFVLKCLCCCCRPEELSTAAVHQSDLKYFSRSNLIGFKTTEMRTVDSWAAESFRSNVSQFSISALLNFYVVLLCATASILNFQEKKFKLIYSYNFDFLFGTFDSILRIDRKYEWHLFTFQSDLWPSSAGSCQF